MREYGFYDSPVMRELERQEIAKNGPDKPIKKAASIEPTDLLSKLANLSKNLRKSGKTEQADRLDYKVAMYVTAAEKNTHLYRTHDEEGEDLIEFAHPDGDVEICPSSGGYGKIETQLSQHKKIVDMVQKEPTGNYATASILEDVAGVLGLKKRAEVDVTTDYNNNIGYILENFSKAENWSDKPNFYFSGFPSTAGIKFDSVGGGLGRNIVVIERGPETRDNWYSWNIKEDYLYRNVLGGNWGNGVSGTIESFEKAHNDLVNGSQAKFDQILQGQKNIVNGLIIGPDTNIEQIDKNIKTLHGLRGGDATIESFGSSPWKLYFINNQGMLNRIADAIGFAIGWALKIRTILGKMEEWAQWQNSYKQGYVKPTVGRILKAMNYFEVNSVEALVPKIQEQIDEYANKKASARFRLEKKAQDFSQKPDTPPPAAAPAAAPPAAAPATKPAPATTGTGRQPARRNLSNNEMQRRWSEIKKWQERQPTQYWQDVITMQKKLHLLADSLSKQKLATHDQLNALRGTAIQYISNTGSFDYDGQWGPGTAKSLKVAKEILSTIQDGKFKTIADKIDTGEPRGWIYDADTIELQNGIAGIAVNNADIISQIMSEAEISDSNVASGTVFDYVPKEWDYRFLFYDKNGEELKSGALSDLRSFSNWLNLNKIKTNIPGYLSYEDSGFLIECLRKLKQRADRLVARGHVPQAYVDAIVALFNKANKGVSDWQAQNKTNSRPTVSDLEASTGSKSTSKAPGTQGSSGAAGEGMDLQTGESSLIQRQVYELLNATIIPKHIAQVLQDANMAAGWDDILAGSIRRNTIETLFNNPEGLFTAIIDVREDNVPWSQILDETGYNHNSPALFFNRSGQAANLEIANSKGERRTATMIQLDGLRGGRNSPPAQRIIREWRLNYLIRGLKAIESDILKITMKIKQNYSDNVALLNKIEDQKVSWVKAINKAITPADTLLRDLRNGKRR